MTPVKFGISFTTSFLNQANALVNVLTDGTIQVSTGATEMGQGVNTKIRQLVADEFGLPVASVQMMETSTEKNHNTSPTAASASTDLNGTAAVQACRAIRERLDEFAAGLLADRAAGIAPSTSHVSFQDGFVVDDRIPHKRIPFGDLVRQARRQRVDLGARGFFATPGVDFNRETGRGTPFLYYTTGCAVSEVTIDRFTGDLRVVRVDLLMDIGQQINPGIDRGQVIGGFIQGMGYVTAEELKYDARGNLLSHSPTTYKIPNVTDVPRIFNVAFIDNPAHRCNLRRSKAVGEPPLMLALSVWAAAKHALSCAAKGALPRLAIPATNEQILRCLRRLSQTSSSGEESALDELPIPDWSSLEVWP
jgi:xanthine dehydrogenase large subunit